jgi:hypothetical protein
LLLISAALSVLNQSEFLEQTEFFELQVEVGKIGLLSVCMGDQAGQPFEKAAAPSMANLPVELRGRLC